MLQALYVKRISVKYIDSSQLKTYLKLGRELPQFLGFGEYFESRTFEWANLSGSPEEAKIALIRSYDAGEDWGCCDVLSFGQVADDDPSEEKFFKGTLEECLSWLESELGGDREKFVGQGMIDQLYEEQCSR